MLQMTLRRFRLPMLSLVIGLSLLLVLATLAGAQTPEPPKLLLAFDPPVISPVAAGEVVKFTIAYKDLPALDPNAPIVLKVNWTGPVDFLEATGTYENQNNGLSWTLPELPDVAQMPGFALQTKGEPGQISVRATLELQDSAGNANTVTSDPVAVQVDQPALAPTVVTATTQPIATSEPPPAPNLTKSSLVITPAEVVAGTQFIVTVTLANTGNVPATEVVVSVIPDSSEVNLEISEASSRLIEKVETRDNSIAFRLLDPLDVGSELKIDLDAAIPDGMNGSQQFRATVDTAEKVTQSLAKSVTIQPPPIPTATSLPTPTETPTAVATTSAPVATTTISPTTSIVAVAGTPTPPAPPPGPVNLPKGLIPALAVILLAIVAIVVALVLLRRSKKGSTTAPVTPSTAPLVPIPPPPLFTSGAYLDSVSVPGMAMRIKDGVTTIGRDPDCDIRITERHPNWETVSRRHAEIRREGGAYVIYDVSNKNGLYVQGLRTAKNLLRPGTPIAIGGVEFVFYDSTATGQ